MRKRLEGSVWSSLAADPMPVATPCTPAEMETAHLITASVAPRRLSPTSSLSHQSQSVLLLQGGSYADSERLIAHAGGAQPCCY